jgi:putative transposase
MTTAKQLNEWDKQAGRKVWFQFRDTRITFEKSYLARLNYIHYNPQKHGVAQNAEDYCWCSAGWFVKNASDAVIKTIKGFKIDRLNVPDDF